MKKIFFLLISLIYNANTMSMQMVPLLPYQKQNDLSDAQAYLTRSFEAHEMSWLPRMYIASGFSQRMSREFFIINTLTKIKESMANARCCPGLQDCCPDKPPM